MNSPETPRRFRNTVAAYQAYRLDYPPRLIDRLLVLAGLKSGDAVLDLGCGPGNLALAFARRGLAVTAMDPEPQMLDAARAAAAAEGLKIAFAQRGSNDLTPADGPFRLAAIGRAFHWMDRAATLAMLDRIVGAKGGVALLHDAHPPVDENAWYRLFGRISEKYGRARMAHVKERGEGGHRRYEPFLFASAFSRIEGLSVTIRQAIDEDAIVGRAFSTSVCARDALGDRAGDFEADLRAALRELSPDGKFHEVAELVAVLARRPDD
jgi:ubiquinone/menaquinone biosynthesis C-methylase UbiE